ncbi:Kinesin-like protein kip2 [Ceratobasidium sp. 423]|nr:Kinesin-like protein kip2 [Ceratobasidium sp. 423]
MDTPSRRGVTPGTPSALPRHIRAPSLSPRKPIPAPRFSQTLTPRPASLIFGKPVTDADLGVVDWQNVQDADISADLSLGDISIEQNAEDKVLVTVRVKPSGAETEADKAMREAWNVNLEKKSLKLKEHYVRPGGPAAGEFYYGVYTHPYEVLTGTDNKAVYASTAKAHVRAAMDGYNAVVFAYGQTASGKTFTLSGSEAQPGIIPRAMRDVFGYIKKHPDREFLLRASYLEIYNEQIYDLLAPAGAATTVALQGVGNNVYLSGVREEPITSFKSVKEVLERGDAGRRTASTDWNERSSRSHSVFRLLQQDLLTARRTIESQERQILSLEAALAQRPLLPSDAPESDKDRLIADLNRTVRELEIVTRGYEDNLGAPLRQVREDVEREWSAKLEEKVRELEEKQAFIEECQRALQKEKQAKLKLEEEKLALISFVRDFDAQVLQKSVVANYTPGGTHASDRTKRARSLDGNESFTLSKKLGGRYGASLLDETPELLEEDEIEDLLEVESEPSSPAKSSRGILEDKENIPL